MPRASPWVARKSTGPSHRMDGRGRPSRYRGATRSAPRRTFRIASLRSAAGGAGELVLLLLRALQRLVNAEARRFLTRRKLGEGLEKFLNDRLSRNEGEHTVGEPFA